MRGCVRKNLRSKTRKERQKVHLRHDARHADQAIDASEAYTYPPQPGSADDLLAQRLVTRCETQDCTGTISNSIMNITTGVTGETGVVHKEAELVEHLCDENCGLLLAIHANSKCLDTTKQEEGIERR